MEQTLDNRNLSKISPRDSNGNGLDGNGISGTTLGIISIIIAIVGLIIGRKLKRKSTRSETPHPENRVIYSGNTIANNVYMYPQVFVFRQTAYRQGVSALDDMELGFVQRGLIEPNRSPPSVDPIWPGHRNLDGSHEREFV